MGAIGRAVEAVGRFIRGEAPPEEEAPSVVEPEEIAEPPTGVYKVNWGATARIRGTRLAQDRTGTTYVDGMANPSEAERTVTEALDSSYARGMDVYYRIYSVVASEVSPEEAEDAIVDDYEDYEVTEDRDVDRES